MLAIPVNIERKYDYPHKACLTKNIGIISIVISRPILMNENVNLQSIR